MFSEEQIREANAIKIKTIIEHLGYKPKKVGNHEYKIEGHGGLYFNDLTNKWYCFSENLGGGLIQFMMRFEGMSWKESIEYLLSFSHLDFEEKSFLEEKKANIAEREKDVLILPERAEKYKRLYAYLIKTRGLSKEVVNYFVKRKVLYENNKGGMVFIGTNKNGEPKYAMIRGTTDNKPYKAEVKNSDKSFSFHLSNVRSKKLVIFESAIDLMSYVTIKQSLDSSYLVNPENLLSLGGVSDKALKQYLRDNQYIKSIEFALDNDEAGELARERFVKEYEKKYLLSRLIFKGKDVNEYLKEHGVIERQEEISTERINEEEYEA